jgi:hypothetical protein
MGFDNDHLGTQMPFGAPSTPSFADNVANEIDPKGHHHPDDPPRANTIHHQACPTVFT